MVITVDQTGAPHTSGGSDQRVSERKPFAHLTGEVERGESYFFVDRNDFIHQLPIGLRRTACFFARGPEHSKASGELGERQTGSQNFGLGRLEQFLDSIPTGFPAKVSQ